MLVPRLADVYALRVLAHQVQDGGGDQAIVEHDVGLLHEPERPEGQEVGIAGTGTHEVDLTDRERRFRALVQRLREGGEGGLIPSGEQHLGHRPVQDRLPESAARTDIAETLFDALAKRRHEHRQPSVGGRHQGLETGAQEAREHGRGTPGRDRDLHRRSVHDRWHDEGAALGVVHDVDGDVAFLGQRRHLAVLGRVIGRGDAEPGAVQILSHEGPCLVLNLPEVASFAQLPAQVGGDDRDAGSGAQETPHLAGGHRAAAHHEAAPVLQLDEDGEEGHGYVGRAALAILVTG